ncbi:hypothetical protein Q4489_03400 [Thalassotalea sp. 1_MG-2023]|uniref:hypothetical protein n=1 Tax=Thalassotalea sp. 1_MG-2023 TaxID=3062680 RepID=UPI0026E25F4F|nr:hypothetical protein [Thalassotalea sp. 1_MG-2023]MDO6426040.1 hypothetical protein [Thalassotalea sp. 1_MG-2023]
MCRYVLLFILVCFVNVSVAQEKPDVKLSKHPETFGKVSNSVILLDVLVDEHGKAAEVKLSNAERYNTFNQFALLRTKKASFPVKYEQGVPVKYWIKKHKVEYQVKPMKTK